MRQSILFAVWHKFDKVEHRFDNSSLELVTAFVPQDTREECKHTSLLARKLETQGADGLHDGNLKLICDLAHET